MWSPRLLALWLLAQPNIADAALPGPTSSPAAGSDTLRRLDALSAPGLEAEFVSAGDASPELPWLALRVGRLRAHTRDFVGAKAAFTRGLAALTRGPTAAPVRHPARSSLELALQRLEARGQAVAGRIGVLLPVSGAYGGIGKSALAAVQLAAEGDAISPRFELFLEDTGGEADRAASAVERLVLDKRVTAIIGPVGALESQAAALAAERLEVPLISLSGAGDVTAKGPFSFRHRLTRAAYARSLAQYALREMGLKTFAVLYPRSDYGRELCVAFWRAIEQGGGEVRAAEAYGPRETQFNTAIKRLVGRFHLEARAKDERWAEINRKARDPSMRVPPIVDFEAVFIADSGERARLVLPFLAYWDVELKTHPEQSGASLAPKYGGEIPPLVQVLGTNGFNNADFAARAGELARNSVFLDEFLHGAPEAGDFTSRFLSATGTLPDTLAAHAFDAARMAGQAGAGVSDRAEVRRRLLAMREFPGVVGKSHFNGDGEIELRLNVLTIGVDGTIQPRLEEQGYGFGEDGPPGPP